MQVKTREYNPFVLEQDLRAAHARVGETTLRPSAYAPALVRAASRRASCSASVRSSTSTSTPTCCESSSARAARSARYDATSTRFPREPQVEPYWCYKHRRECRPVEGAAQFLRRYTLDTLARLKEFARVRAQRTERDRDSR
jgi:hypothetical protein